jgi:hypothetical protein
MNAGTWAADSYGRGDNGMMFGNHFGMMSGGFDGFGPMSLLTISVLSMFFFLAVLWALAIKGYALWHAAKRNEKWWFIAILIINTFGVLELAYLIFFAKVWNLGGKKKEMAQGTQATPAHDHMSSPTHAHAENHSQTHESKEGMEQT